MQDQEFYRAMWCPEVKSDDHILTISPVKYGLDDDGQPFAWVVCLEIGSLGMERLRPELVENFSLSIAKRMLDHIEWVRRSK